MKPRVIIHDTDTRQWLSFSGLQQAYCIHSLGDVVDALAKIEQAVSEHGLWAAGWLGYEASTAFDAALNTHAPGDFPLLWMALFEHCEAVDIEAIAPADGTDAMKRVVWRPNINVADYSDYMARIKHQLAEGNSYQVNYTFKQTANACCAASPPTSGQTGRSPSHY